MKFDYQIQGGVSIRFDGKPSAAIRSALKNNGYRWSPAGQNWWKRSAAGAGDFITWLSTQSGAPPVESPAAPDFSDTLYEDSCRDACGL